MTKEVNPITSRLLQQLAANVCRDLRAETPHGSRLYFHLSAVLQRLALTGITPQRKKDLRTT